MAYRYDLFSLNELKKREIFIIYVAYQSQYYISVGLTLEVLLLVTTIVVIYMAKISTTIIDVILELL